MIVSQVTSINLMEHIDNENIWATSYYIQIWPHPHAKLVLCMTLNLPHQRILKPNHAEVIGQNEK